MLQGDSERSDFYPFGGERVVTQNLSNQHYKFTGKERDSESGNDYFGARYDRQHSGQVPFTRLERQGGASAVWKAD